MMTNAASASEYGQDQIKIHDEDQVEGVPAVQEPSTPARAEAAAPTSRPEDDEFDVALAFMRLLVGVALEGADELTARLREWDAARRAASRAAVRASAPSEALSDSRRYSTVCIIFELQHRVRKGLAEVMRRSDEAAHTVIASLAPALRLTPFDPMMDQLFGLYRDWTDRMDYLAERGKIEEQESRLMARKALPGVIDEVLDVVTKNPEVRALLQEQGVDVAKSALDEARERVGTADALAERIAHTLLRRQKPVDAVPPQPHRKNLSNPNGGQGAKGADLANGAHGAR